MTDDSLDLLFRDPRTLTPEERRVAEGLWEKDQEAKRSQYENAPEGEDWEEMENPRR